jgi:hypothetical protein
MRGTLDDQINVFIELGEGIVRVIWSRNVAQRGFCVVRDVFQRKGSASHEKHEDLFKAIPTAVHDPESVARSMYNKKSIKGQSKKV